MLVTIREGEGEPVMWLVELAKDVSNGQRTRLDFYVGPPTRDNDKRWPK